MTIPFANCEQINGAVGQPATATSRANTPGRPRPCVPSGIHTAYNVTTPFEGIQTAFMD
jgi:hypothetical protein